MKLLELIGNTPLVELQSIIQKPGVTVLAKLEGQNPGGSVKDRAASFMIQGALDRGEINQQTSLIEATSGNTGVALAMIASMHGLQMELVMPEGASIERVLTMRAYGATVTLTPAKGGMEAARDYADEKALGGNVKMLNQFANPDNYRAHVETTGPEIWRDTEGAISHFVSAMGTTGTIMGVSRYLKSQNEAIEIVGAQPTDGSKIPGIRKWPAAYMPKIFDASRVDKVIEVSEQESRIMTRRLAREEGLFCGMSSGGAVAVAQKVAESIDTGVIVCIICDRGDRYLSTDLFQ